MHAAVAPDLLRGSGLRVTAARTAVLETLGQHPHADATQILDRLRERNLAVSVQGVYDVLTTLVGAGIVRRIQPAHSPARYEVDLDDNHHHAVCRSCHGLFDVPCAVGEAPCITPAADQETSRDPLGGFLVDEAEVIYWGTCASCRSPHEPAPPHTPSTTTSPTTKEMA